MNAQVEKARLLYMQQRYTLAATELTQALGKDPENVEAISLFALTLAKLGDIPAALEKSALALSKAPDNAHLHFRAGIVWMHANHLTNAGNEIRTAISLNPNDPDYYAYLANMRLNQSLHQTAIDLADKGLALNPEHVDCLFVRSRALMNLGKHEEAARTNDQCLALAPTSATNHSQRGWIEINRNNPKKAETHFLEALRNNPELTEAHEGLAKAKDAQHPFARNGSSAEGMKTLTTTIAVIVVIGAVVLLGSMATQMKNFHFPVGILSLGVVALVRILRS